MNKRNIAIASVVSGSLLLALATNIELQANELPKDPTGVSPYGSVSFPPGAQKSSTGEKSITVREGTQKVLVLMIEFEGSNPKTFQTKPTDFYNDYFSTGADSISSWIKAQSGGKLKVVPAETKQNGMPEGVVKVTINPDEIVEGNVGLYDYDKQQALVAAALKKVQDQVEWEKIDVDGNGVFVDSFHLDYVNPVKEELVVNAVFAGDAVKNGTGANGPESWPHFGPIQTDVTSSTGKNFRLNNGAIIASERVDGNDLQTSVLGHEYLHTLGARDMYKDRDSIGPWSIMDRCYGNRNGISTGEHLNPIDPLHKLSLGWTSITMLDATTNSGVIDSVGNRVMGVEDPKNSNILYLIENRDFSNHYEKANYRYGMRESGAIVWKIDKRTLQADFLDSDWYVNSGGPKTSIQVLTSNASEGVIVENTLQPVGKDFIIPGVDFTFTAQADGKIAYKAIEDETGPGLGEQVEIFALNRKIKVGDTFKPLEGVKATAGDGTDITDKVKVVENTVNVNRVGTYTVTYSVTHGDTTVTKTVLIEVEPSDVMAKPTIIAPDVSLKIGDKFEPLEGVIATDANGVDITERVEIVSNDVDTSKIGNYIVVYSVTDSGGNTATENRLVVVTENGEAIPDKDTTPPVITGADNKVIYVGDIFDALEGITATDNVDGAVEIKIVSDNVDTKSAGTYTVVYGATDKAGNASRVTREIRVIVKDGNNEQEKDIVAPKINLLDGATSLVTSVGTPLKIESYIEALDDVDGNVKDTLEIEKNTINWNSTGTYTINCSAKDKSGNIGKLSFDVKVLAQEVGLNFSNNTVKVGDTSFDPLTDIKLVKLNSEGDYEIKLDEKGSSLNINEAGEYTVKYIVTNKKTGATHSFSRKINVVATDEEMVKFPELTLPDFKVVTLEQLNDKDKLIDAILKGTNVDKTKFDFEHSITAYNALGKQIIRFTITDKATGATMQYNIAVNGVASGYENGNPVINATDRTVIIGEEFFPLHGVTALDAEDGDLTDKIVVKENNVDSSKLGSYDVTYTVVDSERNLSTLTITVKVVEKTLEDETDDGKDDGKGDANIPGSGGDSDKDDTGKLPGLDKDENNDGGASKVPSTGTIAGTGIIGMFVAGVSGVILKLKRFKK